MPADFRERVARGEPLLGTFIKTPGVHATEILGAIGFDFLVIDQEHGPFDSMTLDTIALAARASRTVCLVRVADASPSRLAGVLDLGFAGVIVPHVTSASVALAAARACRHHGGHRGFTNSSRAGGYGALTMADHVEAADRTVTVVAMVEDAVALDDLGGIVSTPGIDAVLIGRADLAISLGETSVAALAVTRAVDRVLEACRYQGTPAFIFAGDITEAAPLARRGFTGFIIGSDQAFLRTAAARVHAHFRTEISLDVG